MTRLRSATRLTQRVPWLCGPASRRVCYFVGLASASPPKSRAGDLRRLWPGRERASVIGTGALVAWRLMTTARGNLRCFSALVTLQGVGDQLSSPVRIPDGSASHQIEAPKAEPTARPQAAARPPAVAAETDIAEPANVVSIVTLRLSRAFANARIAIKGPSVMTVPTCAKIHAGRNAWADAQALPRTSRPKSSGTRSAAAPHARLAAVNASDAPAPRTRSRRSDRARARTASGTATRDAPRKRTWTGDMTSCAARIEPMAARPAIAPIAIIAPWPTPALIPASRRNRGARSSCWRHHDSARSGRGTSRAWSPPKSAAEDAASPQPSVNAKSDAPVSQASPKAGTRKTPHATSFKKASRPRPAAKKARRQASWIRSPGSVIPRATSAIPVEPPAALPTAMRTTATTHEMLAVVPIAAAAPCLQRSAEVAL